MAIGRISGPMLFSNLDRQGIDLAFDSNLVYLDVTNRRVGISNISPQYAVDSPGNVKLANIIILGNTITSNTGVINLGSTSNIVITGGSSNNVLYTDGLGNLRWGQISDLDISWDNFTVTTGNAGIWYTTSLNATAANLTNATISNISTSNIIISSGNVTANLTGNITGTNATFTGNVNSDWVVANVQAITGNFSNVNVSNVNVTGTLTATGNVIAQKITSPVGDLHISAATDNPNNIIRFDSVSAFDIPSGTTAERPPSPDYGYVRYNTDIGSIEWWGGSQWVAGSNLISTQQIVPDGVSAIYTLNQSTVENAILVNINGTIQQAGAGAYSVSGNQITFAEVPLTTDIIEIRFLASGVAALSFNFANIAGNVSPSANVTYDLGSHNYRWRDLWLSGNTINLGAATLSAVGSTIQLPAGSSIGGANVDIVSINANIAAANAAIITANTGMKSYVDQGLASALFAASSYGNAIVAVYLPLDATITTIQANLGAYQTYANANVVATQANLGAFYNYANTKIGTNTNSNLVVLSTSESTSSITGALVVKGGLGLAGNLFTAGNISTGNVSLSGNLRLTSNGIPTITFFRSPDTDVVSGEIYGNIDFVGEDISTNSSGARVRISSRSTGSTGAAEMQIYVAAAGTANAASRLQVNTSGIRTTTLYADSIYGPSTVYYKNSSGGGIDVTPDVGTITASGTHWYTADLATDKFYQDNISNTFTMDGTQTTANVSLTNSSTVKGAPLLSPAGTDKTNELDIWVTGIHVADTTANPRVVSRLRKRFIATVSYSETTGNWTILDQQLCESVYNSDGINFAAGAVNAGKVFLQANATPGFQNLNLRFDNRTSPGANSQTRWAYTISSRSLDGA